MKKIIALMLIFIINFLSVNILNALDYNIQPVNSKKECVIANIDDGDTFDLMCYNNGVKEYIYNVRTLGINAPDLDNNGNKHCYFDEAKEIIQLIKNEKRSLYIEFYGSDLCKDPYKGCRNLVRIIDKETKKDINELLVIKGYNFSWTNFSMIPNGLKAKYFIAEKLAQKNKNGLWGKCSISYNKKYNYLNSSIPVKMTD